MEQPVRVSLVFPRSGQQIYVHVPLQWTQAMEPTASTRTFVYAQTVTGKDSNSSVGEEFPHRQ